MPEHIVSKKTYYIIFAALMVLTGITVYAATIDFGRLNDIIALTIAVTKAVLVTLFFMHVKYSPRLTKLVVVGGFLWLALLIVLTLADYFTRPYTWSRPAEGAAERIDEKAGYTARPSH
ncbi:MAG TPA: cytochrome C oxidase subunit IV family protein [Blastocatellia bacterium]|nr:cytochrome C oxidase subunit IV family protein [Blastocatellia bacterium]